MSEILISNIGNRNIKYKGKNYPEYKIKDQSFREWTKQLLEDYDSIKGDLSIEILNKVIENPQHKIDKIYLFASDQPGEHPSDTVHEAQILKQLIVEKYGIDDIEIKRQNIPLVDSEQLMKYYRKVLKSIMRFNNTSSFIICDSGGTPQQKSTLKIIAEFLLRHKEYTTYYVTPDKKDIVEITNLEYKDVISK